MWCLIVSILDLGPYFYFEYQFYPELMTKIQNTFTQVLQNDLKNVQVVLIHDKQGASELSNSYTMGCPPVRGDNPRAIASGLSYVQVDKHSITILYHLH